MSTNVAQIADYEKIIFEAQAGDGTAISHDIYRRGSGAPVVLLLSLIHI